jgi:hypothetical protein
MSQMTKSQHGKCTHGLDISRCGSRPTSNRGFGARGESGFLIEVRRR